MNRSNEVIDIEGLRRMSGNDELFISEILQLYTERATKDLNELNTARTSSDFGTIRFVVHRMRSAAVPLGLKNLVVLLKKVEMNLNDEVKDGIENHLDDICVLTKSAMTDAGNQLNIGSARL